MKVRPDGRLKMKELERATGVGRETIRYYIHVGLLPEPQRVGRNVAFYDASFVDRIRLIKQLQQKRFLPLRMIKAIVDGDTTLPPAEVRALADLDRHLLRAAGVEHRRPPVRLAQVAGRTGVPSADIRQLAAVGAIDISVRQGTQWLDESGVRIVELFAQLRAAGLSDALGFGPENLRLYVDVVRWLVREELRVFTRRVAGKAPPEQMAAMVEAAIGTLNQAIAELRTNAVLRSVAQGTVPTAARTSSPRQRSRGGRRGRRDRVAVDAS